MVLRQVARIRSRISEHLVLLVKRLRDLQRHARGKAEAAIRLALEGGEIVEQGRRLGRRLLFLLDCPGLAFALRSMASAFSCFPDSFGARVLIAILLERGSNHRPR